MPVSAADKDNSRRSDASSLGATDHAAGHNATIISRTGATAAVAEQLEKIANQTEVLAQCIQELASLHVSDPGLEDSHVPALGRTEYSAIAATTERILSAIDSVDVLKLQLAGSIHYSAAHGQISTRHPATATADYLHLPVSEARLLTEAWVNHYEVPVPPLPTVMNPTPGSVQHYREIQNNNNAFFEEAMEKGIIGAATLSNMRAEAAKLRASSGANPQDLLAEVAALTSQIHQEYLEQCARHNVEPTPAGLKIPPDQLVSLVRARRRELEAKAEPLNRAHGRANRYLTVGKQVDNNGLIRISGKIVPEDSARLMAMLAAFSRRSTGAKTSADEINADEINEDTENTNEKDTRDAGQRRADGFGTILALAQQQQARGGQQRPGATVHVAIDIDEMTTIYKAKELVAQGAPLVRELLRRSCQGKLDGSQAVATIASQANEILFGDADPGADFWSIMKELAKTLKETGHPRRFIDPRTGLPVGLVPSTGPLPGAARVGQQMDSSAAGNNVGAGPNGIYSRLVQWPTLYPPGTIHPGEHAIIANTLAAQYGYRPENPGESRPDRGRPRNSDRIQPGRKQKETGVQSAHEAVNTDTEPRDTCISGIYAAPTNQETGEGRSETTQVNTVAPRGDASQIDSLEGIRPLGFDLEAYIAAVVLLLTYEFQTDTGIGLTYGELCELGVSDHFYLCGINGQGNVVELRHEERLGGSLFRALKSVEQGVCTMPGSNVPAALCELHHVVPWAKNQQTALDNLILVSASRHGANDDTYVDTRRGHFAIDPETGLPGWVPPADEHQGDVVFPNYHHAALAAPGRRLHEKLRWIHAMEKDSSGVA